MVVKAPKTKKLDSAKPPKPTIEKNEVSNPLKKRAAAECFDDGDFPRGGASVLTPLERREIERQAQKEFDAEVSGGVAISLGAGKKAKHDKVMGTCFAWKAHAVHKSRTCSWSHYQCTNSLYLP